MIPEALHSKPAMPKKVSKDRISSDFIIRNREKEKEFGIADMHFYCYWMHGFSGVLLIIGELFTTDTFTKPFQLKATVVDEDGDKIMVNENFDLSLSKIMLALKLVPYLCAISCNWQHH